MFIGSGGGAPPDRDNPGRWPSRASRQRRITAPLDRSFGTVGMISGGVGLAD